MIFENDSYSLALTPDGLRLALSSADGRPLLSMSLLAAFDRTDGVDETLEVRAPEVGDGTIVVERRSTLWERAWLELRLLDTSLEVRAFVRGSGALTDVRLLGGHALVRGAPLGRTVSGTPLRTLFTPNPETGGPPLRELREGAAIGVVGDGEPGRGRWLFTPAPLYLALAGTRDATSWLDLAVAAAVEELRFVELACEPAADGFALKLDYDGHTTVDGEFAAPALVITPDVPGPYDGLRRHRDDLVARGCAPPPEPRERPGWWERPIFCGWGAQCHLAAVSGGLARDYARQSDYDGFLSHLAEHGLEPPTVVLDDKWQATYGGNEADTGKWPDLRGWIDARHAEGRRVLLWWKAWDVEGLPPELGVRTPDGVAVALDPGNPATREELRRIVGRMLGPDGLDADGLKIDFTARTPSGRALDHAGRSDAGGGWGIALLHRLLAVVYEAAKNAKPDALVITHTPHPAFVDVTDMIRLNDVVGGQDVVEQMEHRAAVARAACPELPIDTDDWPMPDRRSWRAFLAAKAAIGVPSLYYASHVDATGEELGPDDYEAVRELWAREPVLP